MITNLDLFVAQTRLRDKVLEAWLPSAGPQAMSDVARYLLNRTKSDTLPMRLYAHQEEMDRLDEVIAQEEWGQTWGFPLPDGSEPLTAPALEKRDD